MVEILVYGAVISAIYAMLAVGFTLIFGVARILNLAHGAFYALGAYCVYVLTADAHLPLLLGGDRCRCCFVGAFGVGDGAGTGASAPPLGARRTDDHAGGSLMVEQVLLLIFGSEARNVPVDGQRHLPSGRRRHQRPAPAGAHRRHRRSSPALWLFMQHTRLGVGDPRRSPRTRKRRSTWAFPSDRIYSLVMGLSAGIAAAAGVLVGARSRR